MKTLMRLKNLHDIIFISLSNINPEFQNNVYKYWNKFRVSDDSSKKIYKKTKKKNL